MGSLGDQVKTFLEAEGFTVSQRRDLYVGNRRTISEDMEYYFVWVPENYNPEKFASLERVFLRHFEEVATSHPAAAKFMVVPTLEGMSTEFKNGARKWYGVNIRTPVQFFDTNFKWDVDREAASAARQLRERGEEYKQRRIAQPFRRNDTGDTGQDLLEVLRRQLTASHEKDEKSVHVVVGPAGIGKSYLFATLFAELHQAFLDYKTKGGLPSPRPLPLVPEYLPLADGRTVRSLLSAYLQTDFARPLRREVFEWMLTNGFAIWMLDGLDEVIAQDPQFFDYLLDLMTLPNARTKPRVLICVRDSLLATNEEFRQFCEQYPDEVVIYQLARWEMESKREFAQVILGPAGNEFITVLRQRPPLDELASIPYYCNLLAQEFRLGRMREDFSESSLVEHAIAGLIERDYQKGFIDKSLLGPEGVYEFLEAIAAENFGGGFKGVDKEVVRDFARIVLPGLEEDELERMSSRMVNLGTFSQASPGFVRFSEEIIEQYLLGRHLSRLLRTFPEQLVRELARWELPPDGLTIRLMAESVKRDGLFERLRELIYQSVTYRAGFKNIMRIAALSVPNESALRDVRFERLDLSGLHFKGLSFEGVSFRGCNLTDTVFEGCNLRGCDFREAVIRNTGFLSLPPGGLLGAKTGDLTKFFSMKVSPTRLIDSHEEAWKWFQAQTGQKPAMVSPCEAALQLRQIFGKFVYPDGRGRRAWLDRRGVLAGRRFHDAPDEVLAAAIRHGYLREEERFRGRIHRSEGDAYSELVGYVTNLQVTPGIRAVLDDCCRHEGCVHVPRVSQS